MRNYMRDFGRARPTIIRPEKPKPPRFPWEMLALALALSFLASLVLTYWRP